ncbi:BEL1-like homeodomain protein 1 [Salvia miltiorrhiza]|uniref:BEL1-like homeodomain protein 1 n=1 Tax=Salvia miltiorrhiza TaxID=226208 RepID=UPI0025AC8C5F|nr:BEL1-like homeodomain protein 1 [Salvia miltiorrhiza]XP_057778031.1 BEL1-like homeodomain protein 1 [Salvia miltiorrhiza]XP_057778032.1 BEL1-like homeodomain protein 1 [Salvia miltiorrhiza]XP_057778033.1 BEL1-like homeodomain protein 1 [Salvia miltiorrhiza]XP_057778034.1 BEL1-like homeodomain protein 1 [Salvia miltiorrhiza]XP_057778035.1 BEL1-like homeodomain protein 1 [Salvia miltiorrhiza]XP_057778037.1 BEL1-like homeodomain protein 1 [Salvia miltiorrhiza]XP_057778038.1 BEL1-like homeodo
MATYYHGNSEIQGGGDGLQTLILMNPAYVGYSDNNQQPQPPSSSNFVFLNSNSSGNGLHHAPPPHSQHFVGVPLNTTTSAPTTTSPQDHHHDVSVLHGFLPRVPYNLYNLPMDPGAARDVTRAQQGLSLSLSSQQPPSGYGSFRPDGVREVPSQPLVTAVSSPPRCDDVRVSGGSPSSASGVSNGVNGVQSVLLSSKYLKAAQELLDEVVNVGKGVKTAAESGKAGTNGAAKSSGDSAAAAGSGDGQSGADSSAKRGAELSTAERQEIQMKKAKLVNMLDEVEQRYRQYHQQMQMVISWFEQAAGMGSAKTYTALALETISKQFRCLKDAILGQIRGASKSLGEEESLEGKMEGSRLKYVDNQIRQQRALQQLGMIQHNAWRPQRGLPERSVSVLRAWLFEHFLHPYPKDSDKLMLAKQTGLTRSQVSNWFINARVRLWKPMVEEMYMEEMKDHDKTNGSSEVKATTKTDQDNNNMSTPPSTSPTATTMAAPGGFNLIGSSEIDSITQGASPKKLRMADMLHSPTTTTTTTAIPDNKPGADADNDAMSIKFGDRQGRDGGFTLMGAPANFIGGFGSYPIGELRGFGADQFQTTPYSGNGVSLTLGLPHCDNISMSGAHQSFLPNQTMQLGRGGVEIGEGNDFGGLNAASANAHSGNVYDNINIQSRKRFAAQLLPDFVA